MKTSKLLTIFTAVAVLSVGCGAMDDGRLCSDQDGQLVCTQEQALINLGGLSGGLSYVCQDTEAGRVCTCMGFADCIHMQNEVCIDPKEDKIEKCWIAGGETNCKCTGKSSIQTDGIGTSPVFPGTQDLAP